MSVVLLGTAQLRALSFENQKQKRISTLPATQTEVLQTYYHNQKSAAINLIATLCEVGKFLSYTLNSNFMSFRPAPDEKQLIAAAKLYFEYYELLTHHKIDIDNLLEEFMAEYRKSIETRAAAKTPEAADLELKLRRSSFAARWMEALNHDICTKFKRLEEQWMPKLPTHLTMWDQDWRMDARRYDGIGVDTPRHTPPPSTTKFNFNNF